MNCHNVSKSITVNVINDCDCNSGSVKPINDVFGKLSIPKYKNDIEIADWQIISNQSGGFVFDVLFTPNCANRYKLTIEDKDGNVVREDYFSKDQVDKRARAELHEKYPDYLVFRLTLKSLSKLFEGAESYFIINLTSIDESNVSCQPYKSPKLIFTKCP